MRAALAVLVIGVLAGGCGEGRIYDPLASRLDDAQRRPGPSAFALMPPGTTIRAESPSRLTFHARVRDRSWLRTGVQSSGPADGSLTASVGISDGRVFREVSSVALHPDAGITPILVDLRQYAGLTIDIIFNVRGGARQQGAALWVAPALLQR